MTNATLIALLYAAVGWIPMGIFISKMSQKSLALKQENERRQQYEHINRFDLMLIVGCLVFAVYAISVIGAAASYCWDWWYWALHSTPVPKVK